MGVSFLSFSSISTLEFSYLVVSIVFMSIANLFLMYCFSFKFLILLTFSKYFYVGFLPIFSDEPLSFFFINVP